MNGLDVINCVAVAAKKMYFLESVYVGTQAHDAAFLATDIKRVIDKYDFVYVGPVVTDNMATNKSAWELLQPDFPVSTFMGELYAARREGMARNEYALEKLWPKRWINAAVCYLVQWEGYHELTWEPVANIP
ncbi:Transposase putative [Phytophthora palmivora]|uniref:Transposase putative n=1 Tax=Phytophthora palmivora TaxID=4796 RepID=A0A2P4XTV5_9STRA|nr:Transposase putative [Phytophthora palmivora]